MKIIKSKYQTDEVYREQIKIGVRKYYKTKKGKLAKMKSVANVRKRNPEYYANYMKKQRKNAKENGICQRCFKFPIKLSYTMCKKCLNYINNNNKKEKKYKEVILKNIINQMEVKKWKKKE